MPILIQGNWKYRMKKQTKLKLENLIRRLIKEERLHEVRQNLEFWTRDLDRSIMGPFRLGSKVVDLGTASFLLRGIRGTKYGNDIGFDTKSDRRDAMKLFQQAFDSGRMKIEDYPLEKE